MQQCHLKTYCSDFPNFTISTFVRFYQLYLYHLGQKIHWCIIMVTKCFLTIRSTDRILQWLCSCNLVSWETVSCIYLDSSFLFKDRFVLLWYIRNWCLVFVYGLWHHRFQNATATGVHRLRWHLAVCGVTDDMTEKVVSLPSIHKHVLTRL